MALTLEVIKIGNIPMFNREKVTTNSPMDNEIIRLQGLVSQMVREVKAHDGNKKELANNKVNTLILIYGSYFNNLEQSIRELAREMW